MYDASLAILTDKRDHRRALKRQSRDAYRAMHRCSICGAGLTEDDTRFIWKMRAWVPYKTCPQCRERTRRWNTRRRQAARGLPPA